MARGKRGVAISSDGMARFPQIQRAMDIIGLDTTTRTTKIQIGESMRRIRRVLLSLVIALTAVATLIAGTPHFVCRCPNGKLKPFCLGLSFATTGKDGKASHCCCNGTCCSADGAGCKCGKTQAYGSPSCCGGDGQHASAAVDLQRSSQASAPGCARTLTPPELVTVSDFKTQIPSDETCGVAMAVTALPSHNLTNAAGHPAEWREHERPPPTDLVFTLLHLLI